MVGWVDLVTGDKLVGDKKIEKFKYQEDITHLDVILNNDPVHFMLSLTSTTQTDLNLINQAIKVYVASPAYKALLTRYLQK